MNVRRWFFVVLQSFLAGRKYQRPLRKYESVSYNEWENMGELVLDTVFSETGVGVYQKHVVAIRQAPTLTPPYHRWVIYKLTDLEEKQLLAVDIQALLIALWKILPYIPSCPAMIHSQKQFVASGDRGHHECQHDKPQVASCGLDENIDMHSIQQKLCPILLGCPYARVYQEKNGDSTNMQKNRVALSYPRLSGNSIHASGGRLNFFSTPSALPYVILPFLKGKLNWGNILDPFGAPCSLSLAILRSYVYTTL